jgi:exosortase
MFPLLFLVFMLPMPSLVEHGLEVFFQHASAEVSHWFFGLTGTPVFRTDLVFQMPDLTIQVAQECSGIRSSYVLFITSLLAGHMFLASRWARWFLAFFVVPLGIVRNAFRIVSISLLTMHVDPGIIHGPLHKRGGPLFFLLSLIPFFLVLLWLKKRERKSGTG